MSMHSWCSVFAVCDDYVTKYNESHAFSFKSSFDYNNNCLPCHSSCSAKLIQRAKSTNNVAFEVMSKVTVHVHQSFVSSHIIMPDEMNAEDWGDLKLRVAVLLKSLHVH